MKIILTKFAYFPYIYYDATFQFFKFSTASVDVTSQVQSSAMLLLLFVGN